MMYNEYLLYLRAQRIAYRNTQRAHKLKVKSDLTSKEILKLFEDTKECYYCHTPFKCAYEQTIDHYTPMCHGGANTLRNVVVCCDICNAKKSHYNHREFSARFVGRVF